MELLKNTLKKGSKIYVEGELQTRKWQDQAGNDRYTTEVVLQGYNCNLTLLDSRSNNNIEDRSESIQEGMSDSSDNLSSSKVDSSKPDDDIPF